MNKSELVDALAAQTGSSKTESAAVIDALFSAEDGIIASALKKGDRVQVAGFGSFLVRSRSEREGRNPRTGETIRIAASRSPAFKAGKGLKDAI